MPSRFGACLRLCGILLLALAISPLTAPFSTLDPGLFFGDDTPHTGAILQAKPASSEPIASAGGTFEFRVRLAPVASRPVGGDSATRTRILFDPPLRI